MGMGILCVFKTFFCFFFFQITVLSFMMHIYMQLTDCSIHSYYYYYIFRCTFHKLKCFTEMMSVYPLKTTRSALPFSDLFIFEPKEDRVPPINREETLYLLSRTKSRDIRYAFAILIILLTFTEKEKKE
jgi:hypothetical protein